MISTIWVVLNIFEDNFKKGATELLVLTLLKKRGDMYGYQLIQAMLDLSNGLFSLQEASLYPILYRLSECGYISCSRVKTGKRSTRIYYHIESLGVRHLEDLMIDYSKVKLGIELILNNEQLQD